jgi:integrase
MPDYVWKNRGRFYARVPYIARDGKKKHLCEQATSYTAAKVRAEQMVDDLAKMGLSLVDARQMTFAHLLAHYRARYVQPPRYSRERKISGLRSYKNVESFLKAPAEHFSTKLLRSFTYNDFLTYKLLRLATPARGGKERSATGVNREMEILRRMFNIARRLKWISSNPFDEGDPLISKADEEERMRILTHEEAARLLSVCVDKRAHLRAVIICALDTAMRANELFSTNRLDVQRHQDLIIVRTLNSKVNKKRLVPITARLAKELDKLEGAEDAPLFPFRRVKRSFATACRLAGIEGFRFHDLRHTAITWMVESGMADSDVMKIAGISNWKTFLRYKNINSDIARRMSRALDTYQAGLVVEDEQQPEIIAETESVN